MANPIVGYIVTAGGTPLCLDNGYEDAPRGGVLLRGEATLFESRRRATAAIERTIQYVTQNHLRWETDFRIFPVRKAVRNG